MTDYNYKLTYNGNLRWTDYRGPNPSYSPGIEIRLDIVTFDNDNRTVCHIHNYHTNCMAESNKHVKTTLSAFVGVGRLTHEIFGTMYKLGVQRENYLTERNNESLFVAYEPHTRLSWLISSWFFREPTMLPVSDKAFWHKIPLINLSHRSLVVAIPLTNIGVK